MVKSRKETVPVLPVFEGKLKLYGGNIHTGRWNDHISFFTTVIIMFKKPSEVQKWYLLASVGLFVYLAAN